MTVRKEFTSSQELNLLPETIDKLLVTSILIKFLEDITDDKGKHTLRNLYKKHKIQTFAEVVENGLLVSILNDLSNEFNGKIDKFSELEKNQIANANLNLLANFLRANINLKTNQLFIWEQYSFKHLPAEVISAIYENFIQAESVRNTGGKEKGVVYTPIHLVNLLIDEVMPLDKPELFKDNSFRVFDPSCGSGVFLVAAFKRLLQWWAINNSTRDNIQYPDSKNFSENIGRQYFGVDLKKNCHTC
ncbi:N-6 DNA methylase [Flavobacterium phycosphaerae]|uniref:N-6 DNA methylase n=1 Tax=Flavobacterium phycosphaerae TaxID=2697515 RepID=UPI00138AB0BC|nr:N-6 DNA methylase [Flavobacterium phycosphaerae]